MAFPTPVDGICHADDPRTLGATQAPGKLIGQSAPTTTATTGFPYIPVMSGPPTGTPTAVTGFCPIVLDSTNNKLWVYINGAWKGVVVA